MVSLQARYGLVLLVFICLPLVSVQAEQPPEGYSHEEALQAGERMYREGILPSGEPMQALVMGDIPFDGRMFTCDDCHQRSGLGSVEGTVITWPTNGKELLLPRKRTGAFRQPTSEEEKQNARRNLPKYFQVEDVRPPYNDKTLARVLRLGKDSADRSLDPIMPKYRLSRDNMALMIYYLKHLSVDLSPGVEDQVLHFATVIGAGVPDDKKAAMLDVLQTHIDTHNVQGRHNQRRSAAGPFYKSERHQAYRQLKLHVWELHGPEETWRAQLDRYYQEQPVFGLLGGITEGSWAKIHAFSEENMIPSIFPVTDQPVISDSDWYTLYFSKGYYFEGESVAKFVRAEFGMEGAPEIVQIYRQDDSKGVDLGRGFAETWKSMGGGEIQELVLGDGDSLMDQGLDDLLDTEHPVVVLAWLDDSEQEVFKNLVSHAGGAEMIFASASLLHNDFATIPEELKKTLLLTYPRSLPTEGKRSRFAVKRWLEARKIPVSHFEIQAKMYFLGWMLSGGIKSMRSEFYRDYFLEGFDMMIDQDYAIAVYPRLTFGPGQRYSAKGCYIVKLTGEGSSGVQPVSEWVIY